MSTGTLKPVRGGLDGRDGFAQWSTSYDEEPNPLLSLEERFLAPLLPSPRGLSVVDLGCGTGRWLQWLARHRADSLKGIDTSPQMLSQAAKKLGSRAQLYVANCLAPPVGDAWADLALACFVLSYLDHLEQFAVEVRRIIRPGGKLFLSDVHPDTAASFNWKRAFRSGDTSVELPAHARSIRQVLSCFESCGFQTVGLLTPEFGPSEETIFRRAAKLDALGECAGHPAIYIAELRADSCSPARIPRQDTDCLALTGARVAIDAHEAVTARLSIECGRIVSIDCQEPGGFAASQPTLDLGGYLLLPGLINSHDHLEFGLFPNLGRGPYLNSKQWAEDIQLSGSNIIRQQRQIPKHVRMYWGAIRNLLCGVTTVCHHNPITPELLAGDFPVRVLTEFEWAHSLALEPELASKLRHTPRHLPFVLHAAEGHDASSADELYRLDRAGALDERTVIVHGLALDDSAVSLLNRRGAALVWCPSSNQFLFGRTHHRTFLARVNNVVLGSDSPLTAAGDFLDEVAFAQRAAEATPDDLYHMVFTRPGKIFHLPEGAGSIRPDCAADLVAVLDNGDDPANRFAQISSADVALVILRGRVQLVSDALLPRLPKGCASGLNPLQVADRVVWVRAPVSDLYAEASRVLGDEFSFGGKRVRHVDSTRE